MSKFGISKKVILGGCADCIAMVSDKLPILDLFEKVSWLKIKNFLKNIRKMSFGVKHHVSALEFLKRKRK